MFVGPRLQYKLSFLNLRGGNSRPFSVPTGAGVDDKLVNDLHDLLRFSFSLFPIFNFPPLFEQ